MQYRETNLLLFSPTDLYRFVESRFASWMDRYALERPDEIRPEPPDEETELLFRKGNELEQAYLQTLIDAGETPYDVSEHKPAERLEATLSAMQRGEPLIWQASLRRESFQGRADLLVKVPGKSKLGDYHYLPRDVKLGLSAKPKYVLQVCCYAEMLESTQGRLPETLELVLGNLELESLRTVDQIHYYQEQRRAFLDFHESFDFDKRPVPELGEDHADWTDDADRYLEEIDHLSRVANIRRTQIAKLEAAGITTMEALGASTLDRVPKLNNRTFDRLRRQARLQRESEGQDRPLYEVLPPDPDGPPRGLELLPTADPADVYFDMEGSPMLEVKLEYLFGASVHDGAGLAFHDWWAHDTTEEKAALEGFIDWVHGRWRESPALHIYHYHIYETTALKRLASAHATREAELDQLLRNEVFVDLYQVVRHGVLVGEPGYSIKNLEKLYRDHRRGEVTSAVDSIVEYQRFIDAGEPRDWRKSDILRGIRDYNRDDCESTAMLAQWLRARQREHGIAFRGKSADDDPGDPEGELTDDARRRRELAETILGQETDPVGVLLGQLLEFHRREDKPKWWEVFRRREMSDDELVEDLACLGGLEKIDGSERPVRRSTGIRYRFDPDQDTRLDEGDDVALTYDHEMRGKLEELDRETGEALVVFGPKVVASDGWPPPARLSLMKDEFYSAKKLQDGIEAQARQWVETRAVPDALACFLRRLRPRIEGHDGGDIVVDNEPPSDVCVAVVPALLGTTLSIQGPPGSGKTYTAARTVLELLQRGKRIGITSNSHKAILNLLAKCAELNGAALRCLKVGGDEDDPLLGEIPGVQWTPGGRDACAASHGHALIGGTAWHFASPELAGSLDYLFVDEAGQVSVANLVAMARAARNLVLVGDQMQLAQPTQAVHPDESGHSTLQYLLQGERTIPPDAGVFLDVTYRLHPEICRVNSEAFYEGKLHSAPGCEKRVVVVPEGGDGRLSRGAGILFVPVVHEGNTQGSDEEAEMVAELFAELQGLEVTGLDGEVASRLGLGDVLVVAPYNMQVRKLKAALPAGARVGTVDKFQGQEAPVVIVSMCASEGEDSPRGIEFLLNPNRLNVALSRAQSLAVVVGHPGLARTRCRSLDQMKLVNLFCRVVGEG